MGYTTGAKILPDIMDEIAAALIASAGGYWTDGDTAWTTATKTGNLARRCLKYTNGGEVMYLALESINSSMNIYLTGGYWRYATGLRVTFSAAWDGTGHAPTSRTYHTFIQFEGRYNGGSGDMATIQVTYYLWVDATGFVITGKPEPNATDDRQGSFFLVVERNPNKEYTDGFSNFFCYNACNYMNGTATVDHYMTPYIRPFTYQNRDYNQEGMPTINVNGIYFPACPWTSFKSVGNGKVYYIKPIYFNTADRRTPIAQSEMFFAYAETVGLIDGDVIAIEGQTTKYLCKGLDSPDTTGRLTYAIKYVA